ncbi:MAG: histidinol-phosphatase HisJ family protein [Ruminococcaceae bacterium]|nr:histidinol-phosphatase HisJ family protein [Oscillospiraceae bacterium]
MLVNYHTHTTFCDGENTPEEIVLYAIENGFSSIGFSGHGYTPFDLRYCMKDTAGYIEEIFRLKNNYGKKIEIYCGVEEDAFSYTNRNDFDYIIGSSHYFRVGDKYYPIDSSYDYFKKCLEIFEYDVIKLAENYYRTFVSYIRERKPDIVGHFDVITKFDEIDTPLFLNNSDYLKIAEKYMKIAAQSDVIFEINTGAMSRKIRKTPYLGENLLYVLKTQGSKVILSSDSHSADTLNAYFDEVEYMLKEIGFNYVYELSEGEFKKRFI